jgi:aldose 1-epimerase
VTDLPHSTPPNSTTATQAPTGRQIEIEAGDHRAVIVEVGAGVRRYDIGGAGGIEILAPYGEHELPPRYSGATLAPWPNRIRGGRYSFDGVDRQLAITDVDLGNAMHGLAVWERWSVIDQKPHAVTLALHLVPQYGYPFELRLEVRYELNAETGLTSRAFATNVGPGPAPFGFGAHPYLSLRGADLADVSLELPTRTMLVADAAQIPVRRIEVAAGSEEPLGLAPLGDLRLDTGFVRDVGSVARLRMASGGADLWMDDAFGYLQVFTCPDLAHGTPAVAIEPMTGPANAFASGEGLLVLAPGESWVGSWGVTGS